MLKAREKIILISLCLIGFFADIKKKAPFKDAKIVEVFYKIEKNIEKH